MDMDINGLDDNDLDRIALRNDHPPGSAERDWFDPDVTLLGSGRRAAPTFPTPLLGPFWSAWAERAAASASAPVDYVAVALLASAGAAIGNVRWPVAGASWSEPPILWCGMVGSPSSGKSPAMDAAFRLVRHAEDVMAADFDGDRRRYETDKQVAAARREAWQTELKIAVKAGEAAQPMPREAEDPEPPTRPRIRVADATTEKLGALAAALPRGLLIVRDELSGWLGAFDRYSSGGSDRSFAIESYGGRSYVVDRMKNADPLRIRHLTIGALGGIQPDKLEGVLGGPDDGLASRLLWTWPDTLAAFNLNRRIADDDDATSAFARLTQLDQGTDQLGFPEPLRLRLVPAGEDVIEAFARQMQHRANEASGIFAGTLGKARGHALRLACVLEHLWWCGDAPGSEPENISAEAVKAAVGLIDGYFVGMAERVYGDASIPAAERRAMFLARHLRRKGSGEFNARELRREVGGPLRDAALMDEACKALVDAGLIREQFTRRGGREGRRARNYEVNPIVIRRSA